jgi:hypothetical protein
MLWSVDVLGFSTLADRQSMTSKARKSVHETKPSRHLSRTVSSSSGQNPLANG